MFGLLVYVSSEEDFGGEVVGVTIEERSGGICALGIADAVAFGILEEVEVEHFCLEEVPTVVGGVDEIARHDDLVEEVPLALVCECADATAEDIPPGVEESVGLCVLGFALGAEGYGARFIHGVVVEVAHYYHAHLGVDTPEAVGDMLG